MGRKFLPLRPGGTGRVCKKSERQLRKELVLYQQKHAALFEGMDRHFAETSECADAALGAASGGGRAEERVPPLCDIFSNVLIGGTRPLSQEGFVSQQKLS